MMADEYHDALLRLLLRNENAWLKIEINKLDFKAAQGFLHSCPEEQLSKLRSPGKLALNLSIDDWESRVEWIDMHKQWFPNTHKWSTDYATKKVIPWVVFKRAGFPDRREEYWFQGAVRRAYKKSYETESAVSQQSGMIRDALLNVCQLNRYARRARAGSLIRTHKRTAEEPKSIECYVQGIEYDEGVSPTEMAA
jgi:hypothetical protein